MAVTLGTAAQATGAAKSTILRAIKAGRISASRDETGQWQIQPVELFRVFPALAIPGATAPSVPALPDATTDGMVKLLQDQLADMRAQIADLREDRDHWREAFETTQRRLPVPALPDATADETPRSRWQRAWRWMRKTG